MVRAGQRIVALGILFLPALSGSAQTTTPATGPAADWPVFRDGKQLLLVYSQRLEMANGIKMEMIFDCPLKVTKGSGELLNIEMTFRRIRYSVQGKDIDTDDKYSLADRRGEQMAGLKAMTLYARVTLGGEIRDFTAKGGTADKVGAERLSEEKLRNFRQMLESAVVYLPARAATEGQQWKVGRSFLAGPWIGGAPMLLEAQTDCKLGKIGKRDDETAAAVALSGQFTGKTNGASTSWTQQGSVTAVFGKTPRITTNLELTGKAKDETLKVEVSSELSSDPGASASTSLPASQAASMPVFGPTSRPAGKPAPAGASFDFKPLYRAGQKVPLSIRQVVTADIVGKPVKIDQHLDLELSLAKGKDEEQLQAALVIKRIRRPGINNLADTDDIKTMGYESQLLWGYKGMTITAMLGAGGTTSGITGGDQAAKQYFGRIPVTEDASKATKAVLEAWFVTMMADPVAYLPRIPVKVGDTWNVNRRTCTQILLEGAFVRAEKTVCRLQSVTVTPEGRVAVIELEGQWKPVKVEESEIGEFTDATLKKTGEIHYNIDKATLEYHRAEMTGSEITGSKDKNAVSDFVVRQLITFGKAELQAK